MREKYYEIGRFLNIIYTQLGLSSLENYMDTEASKVSKSKMFTDREL